MPLFVLPPITLVVLPRDGLVVLDILPWEVAHEGLEVVTCVIPCVDMTLLHWTVLVLEMIQKW